MQSRYGRIKDEIARGNTDEALRRVDEALSQTPGDACLYYLRGRAHMRRGDRRQAMNAFMQAKELGDDGPAAEALDMLKGIMDFYNKDLYNP